MLVIKRQVAGHAVAGHAGHAVAGHAVAGQVAGQSHMSLTENVAGHFAATSPSGPSFRAFYNAD